MFPVLSDPAIYEFENIPPPSVERLAAGYRLRESRTSPDGCEKWLNWVVRLTNQEAAGYVQATVLESGASYIAYEFASKHWRKGIASASVGAMMGELVESYGVHTFVAVLKTANYRSMELLRHLGFTLGTLTDAELYEAEQDETVLLKAASAYAVGHPTTYGLRTGCIAERSELVPRMQIWCESAQDWSMNIEALPARGRE